ncbi:MAG: hypothetical protein ABIL06_13315 [Pseudomonadota bacterium]|uniref:N-acetyltransferase domain-containing protein n=1 Tax=viral metagenome TaxID=1070528 RepID=A0A6H1ZHZ6_9ZZZZ
MDITLERYTYSQLAQLYPAIHDQVFDEQYKAQQPSIIYLIFDGEEKKYVGFLSGYYQDAISFYIQRIGIPRENRGKQRIFGLLRGIEKHLISYGHKFLIGNVEASNNITLLIALRDGWHISGMHTDTSGTLYVRIIKKLEE